MRFFRQSTYIERLIIYFLLAALFSRVVLEFVFGMWWYKSTQPKLIFLLLLIVIDHGIWFVRGGMARIASDARSTALLLFFGTITLHGVLVGAAWGEGPIALADDSFPLVFLLVTVLRAANEPQPDMQRMFDRLLWLSAGAILLSMVVGMAGLARGLPTKAAPDIIALAIYTALFFAMLATETRRQVILRHVLLFLPVLIFSIEDLNRTTMAFLALGALIAVALRFRIDQSGAVMALVLIGMAPLSLPFVLVEGSKTHARIATMFDPELRESSVSLQSREIEAQNIARALRHDGPEAQRFGLGHGATYEFRIFYQFEAEHTHAHYATALFNLRYGAVGKIYVTIIGAILLYTALLCLPSNSAMVIFFGMLSITSFVYLFTYANFFNFLFGLPLVGMLNTFRKPNTGQTGLPTGTLASRYKANAAS